MRITYDPAADAAYIYLTGERLTRGRTSIPATPPEGIQAFVVPDWKEDRLGGIEILDASSHALAVSLAAPRRQPGTLFLAWRAARITVLSARTLRLQQ